MGLCSVCYDTVNDIVNKSLHPPTWKGMLGFGRWNWQCRVATGCSLGPYGRVQEDAKAGCALCARIIESLDSVHDLTPDYPIQLQATENALSGRFSFELVPPTNEFEVYPCTEPVVAGSVKGTIHTRSDSDECFALITAWLTNCVESHKHCQRPKFSKLPTRVIDVGGGTPPREPFIFESQGQHGRYVALSHCWGKARRLTATTRNIEVLKKGIPLATLPATFQHAVTITRKLGIQYIWIDCLCILQDSTEDWAREAAEMREIYMNSHLTISAKDGHGSFDGILNQRSKFQFVSSSADQAKPPRRFGIREVGRVSPLDKRGWTLQEYVLAPALLHYCDDMLWWECNSMVASEEDLQSEETPVSYAPWTKGLFAQHRTGLVGSDMLIKVSEGNQFNAWLLAIETYTMRSFTVKEDRLPAILGLISAFAKRYNAIPLAGLWYEDLERGLLWFRVDDQPKASLQGPATSKRGASWHWVSVDYPVLFMWEGQFRKWNHHSGQRFHFLRRLESSQDLHVVDIWTETLRQQGRSHICQGVIQAYGHLKPLRGARFSFKTIGLRIGSPSFPGEGVIVPRCPEKKKADWEFRTVLDLDVCLPKTVYLLKIGTWNTMPIAKHMFNFGYYLVLEKVSKPRGNGHPSDAGSFRRIGVGFEDKDKVDSAFSSSRRRFLTLI